MDMPPPLIVIFDTRLQAENAVRDLQQAGFDMMQLAIIGNGYDQRDHGFGGSGTADRRKYWAAQGDFWNRLGPLLIDGSFMTSMVAGLSGAEFRGELSELGAKLYAEGVSREDLQQFEAAVKAAKFLVVVHAPPEDTNRAGDILGWGKNTISSPTAYPKNEISSPV